jgi:hypothetical protein
MVVLEVCYLLPLSISTIRSWNAQHNRASIAVNGKVRNSSYDVCNYLMTIELLVIESVGFLVAVKEALENPMELLLDNNPKRHLSCKN